MSIAGDPLYELALPMPPSLNGYYLNAVRTVMRGATAGKRYVGRQLSAAGVDYRREVVAAVRRGHRSPPALRGRLSIVVLLVPEDRRAFDLDNRFKCLLDALTYAAVIQDDALFDDIRMVRWNPSSDRARRCLLRISRFDPKRAIELANSFGIFDAD